MSLEKCYLPIKYAFQRYEYGGKINMEEFKIGEIVAIPIKESYGIGEIEKFETFFDDDYAWVNTLGEKIVMYPVSKLKHIDLRKALLE